MAKRLDAGGSSWSRLPFKGNGVGVDDSLGVYPPFQSCGLQFINHKAFTMCRITVMKVLVCLVYVR